MRSDPDLGKLLRADLDASAKHAQGYDVEKGVARHLALIAGVGAAAATATVTTTATASTSSVATAAGATTAATATATATTTAATGIGALLGVKTMIAIAAIGVVSATGGVIAVKRASTPTQETKPAVVTTQAAPAIHATAPVTDTPKLDTAPTITPDDLPLSMDGVPVAVPAPASSQAETDNYAQARSLAATDPAGALALVESGNKRFTRGVFVEEREALAVDCLARTGRMAEAQERGKAFLAKHPTSPFAEKIHAQIDSH